VARQRAAMLKAPTLREAAGRIPFDHPIALAAAFFQPRTVDHCDVTACVSHKSGLLQFERAPGHAFAAHPQHVARERYGRWI